MIVTMSDSAADVGLSKTFVFERKRQVRFWPGSVIRLVTSERPADALSGHPASDSDRQAPTNHNKLSG